LVPAARLRTVGFAASGAGVATGSGSAIRVGLITATGGWRVVA
jgi:hypothetical protein